MSALSPKHVGAGLKTEKRYVELRDRPGPTPYPGLGSPRTLVEPIGRFNREAATAPQRDPGRLGGLTSRLKSLAAAAREMEGALEEEVSRIVGAGPGEACGPKGETPIGSELDALEREIDALHTTLTRIADGPLARLRGI